MSVRRHRDRLLARLHQDGDSIVLEVGDETRDLLRHYLDYPAVLARLDRLSASDLKKRLVRAIKTKRSSCREYPPVSASFRRFATSSARPVFPKDSRFPPFAPFPPAFFLSA